jgi:hypothetical protein
VIAPLSIDSTLTFAARASRIAKVPDARWFFFDITA